jgi:excisionase family DNA binding protein
MTVQTEPYLTTGQVADILHVSPKTVAHWAKEGKLPYLRTLGGHRRYPEAAIRELAASLVGPPSTGTGFNPPKDEDERDV